MKHRRATIGAAFVLGIACGGVAGCTGGDDRPTSSVIVPDRPGEPNKTVPATKGSAASPGPADIRFVEMMVPHHQQAVEMAALAPEQAASPKVKALADRIGDAQTAEISQLRSWLRQHIRSVHGHRSAAHSMPGMATPQQMDQLKKSTGQSFDRLFLTLMITHHQGALTMAQEELTKGTDVIIQDIAQEVAVTQTAEINRMRALL
jgi:uncharacterized protein (DUF305 family)